MQRRQFLQTTPLVLGASYAAYAEGVMPMAKLGKTGLQVSRFTLGGAHMHWRKDEALSIRIIHRAMDLGVNFFDSAAKYHDGRSDEVYGVALAGGRRQKVLLMSKAEKRDKASAMAQLENTLRRMKTDYLDLWQCHEVVTQAEVDKILGPGGSLEAFVQAKKEGKVRHIGFTGHADPEVHLRLLRSFDGWETVQHPVNLIDPHYLSFVKNVLPEVGKKGWGRIGMKSNAMGGIGNANIATITECLRFSWSQSIDTLVSGVETVEQLEHNVGVLKSLEKMAPAEVTKVLERTKQGPVGAGIEKYKRKPDAAGLWPAHEDGVAD